MPESNAVGDELTENQTPQPKRPVRWGSRAGVGLAIATVLLIAGIAMLCIRKTDGMLVYALDDAYIHLALARTLAEHGILGVNAQTPAAASSSPLWTLALTLLTKLWGTSVYYPLALNVIAAAALVLLADTVLRDQFGLSGGWRIAAVAVMVTFGPLVPLVMVGMEHVAHAAAVLALVWYALRSDRPSAPGLFALAFIAVGLRYESAFIIAALAVVLVMRRRPAAAAAVIAGGAALVLGVGIYQLQMEHHLLPNSLLAKGVPEAGVTALLRSKVGAALRNAQVAPLAVLVVAAFIAVTLLGVRRSLEDGGPRPRDQAAVDWTVVFTGGVLMHWLLADIGWYDRYEAYLVMFGVILLSGLLAMALGGIRFGQMRGEAGDGFFRAWQVGLVLVLVVTALVGGIRASKYMSVSEACKDIYEQQYQMARFVSRYYPDETIVINDIGYVSYLSEGQIVDLWGLATLEVTDAMRAGTLDEKFVENLARQRGAPVAITYRLTFIPQAWEEIASWTIRHRRVAYSDTVHFFAIESDRADEMEANLREFEILLPEGVSVCYAEADRRSRTLAPRDGVDGSLDAVHTR